MVLHFTYKRAKHIVIIERRKMSINRFEAFRLYLRLTFLDVLPLRVASSGRHSVHAVNYFVTWSWWRGHWGWTWASNFFTDFHLSTKLIGPNCVSFFELIKPLKRTDVVWASLWLARMDKGCSLQFPIYRKVSKVSVLPAFEISDLKGRLLSKGAYFRVVIFSIGHF
jgi:hypothetical protein